MQKGADKGAIYQMASHEIRIGRAEDNDIVINDPKCSRYHAVLEVNADGIKVLNISTNNKLLVNGLEVTETYLQPNALISIGDTDIQLFTAGLEELAQTVSLPQQPSPHFQEKKKSKVFYIYAALGIGALYLFLSDAPLLNNKESLNDEASIQNEILEAQKITEQLQNLKYSSGKDSKQYLDAQEEYLKGFRDYREGNYSRAITSFQAAIALYPKHDLARKYEVLAKRKLDELIQISMQEGNRYMEQGRYDQAQAAYRNVMILIKTPDNLTYREAKAKYDQAQAIIEGGF